MENEHVFYLKKKLNPEFFIKNQINVDSYLKTSTLHMSIHFIKKKFNVQNSEETQITLQIIYYQFT